MTCTITLSHATMRRLLNREAELNIGIDELITQLLDDTEQDSDGQGLQSFDDAKALALSRARETQPGTTFRLEELFSPEEWKRIPARRSLGRYFRKDAEEEGFLKHVGKTETNHAIYERV